MVTPLPKSQFKHLLLDLDGTLIYSGTFLTQIGFIRRILPQIKGHRGWRKAWKALKESSQILKIPSKTQTNEERLIEVFQNNLHLTREKAKEALHVSLLDVFPKLEKHFGEMKGAAEFTRWAKDRYSLTLTTNPVWPVELVHMRMRWGGIDPALFESITTADRMHACKPLPEYYQEVLALENFEAKDCILIGNERKMDLPATAVGIAVFLIRKNAKEMTTLMEKTDQFPGAWRGNFQHLQAMLSS